MLKSKIKNFCDNIFSKYCFAITMLFYSFVKCFYFTKTFKLPTYFIAAYGLAALCYRLLFNHNLLGEVKEYIYGLVIVLSCIVSIIVNNSYNLINLQVLIVFIIMFLVAMPESKCISDGDVYNNLYKFSVVCSILCFIYILISFLHFLFVDFSAGRPRGMLYELTYFAQLIVVSIGTSVYVGIYTKNSFLRKFAVINVAFSSFVLLLTAQRGSIFPVVFSLVYILALFRKNNICILYSPIRKLLFLLFALIAFVSIVILAKYEKINLAKITNKVFSGLNLRDILYSFGLHSMAFNKNYIFGASRGEIVNQWNAYLQYSFSQWEEAYNSSSIIRGCITQVAIHSTVLEQLFIHGIIGLVSLLVFYFKLVIIFLKNTFIRKINFLNKKLLALIIASLFCVFSSMFDSLFNRALFFDIVYIQNICFAVYAGVLLRVMPEK